MEFNDLTSVQKISLYFLGISFLVKAVFDSYFWTIWINIKYVQKNKEKLESKKIKTMDTISFGLHIVTSISFVLMLLVFWEFFAYLAKPIP